MTSSWFVDAWAVFDGFLFASERRRNSIDAKRTIFVAPPEFEPMPIGKISTALRATRNSFQVGFRTPNGEEIEFSSISQIVELARRAYLASGLGHEPIGGLMGPAPQRPNEPSGAAFVPSDPEPDRYHPVILEEWRDTGALRPFVECLIEGKPSEAFGGVSAETFEVQCGKKLNEFAAGIARRLEKAAPRYDWSAQELLSGAHLAYFLERCELLDVYHLAPSLPSPHLFLEARRDSQLFSVQRTLASIPLPHVPEWTSVQTLSDKLLLALSSAHYFSKSHNDFVPAVFCAMLVGSSPTGGVWPWTRDRRDTLSAALRWLSENVAQTALPDEAESALYDFAWDRLNMRKTTNAPVPPSPPEPTAPSSISA